MFDDIFGHPELWLSSRRPIWSSMPSSVWSAHKAWKEDWAKQKIPNQFLITDPTSCQQGFDLKRSDWTILNRYRTGHGICAVYMHVWGIRDDPLCACGSKQTMSHIVNECPADKIPWWASGASLREWRFNHMALQAQHKLEDQRSSNTDGLATGWASGL